MITTIIVTVSVIAAVAVVAAIMVATIVVFGPKAESFDYGEWP